MNIEKQFYAILKQACEKRGGQKDLIEQAGIGQSVLSRILSGDTKDPGLRSVSAILDALGYYLCHQNQSEKNSDQYVKLHELQLTIKKLEGELAEAKGEINALHSTIDKLLDKFIVPNPKKNMELDKIHNNNFRIRSNDKS